MDDDPGPGARAREADAREPDGPEAGPVTDADAVDAPDDPADADAVDDSADADAPDDPADGPVRVPIEPESVNLEHAAFVLLGAVLTLVVVASVL